MTPNKDCIAVYTRNGGGSDLVCEGHIRPFASDNLVISPFKRWSRQNSFGWKYDVMRQRMWNELTSEKVIGDEVSQILRENAGAGSRGVARAEPSAAPGVDVAAAGSKQQKTAAAGESEDKPEQTHPPPQEVLDAGKCFFEECVSGLESCDNIPDVLSFF